MRVDRKKNQLAACSDRSWRTRLRTAIALGLMLVTTPMVVSAGPPDTDFFESRIRPVLIDKCYSCHSASAKRIKGGLRLDTRETMRKGGETGPAVVPGNPEESLILRALAHTEDFAKMPPEEKLPLAVIADFRRWVEMGAPDPRVSSREPMAPADQRKAAGNEESPWWSLRPVSCPEVPLSTGAEAAWVRTPIDEFIIAKLREKDLKPQPEADRRTLIRRLSFDLTGLPPDPAEIQAFLSDESPLAYDRLVDRLLASPHHGERWARHWIDLVHFAETHGHDQDRIRPHAWPYRDYLIESFNRDTPYARFVQEQLAADVLFPEQPRLTVALGMIAAGPWDESSLRDIRDDSIDRQVGFYIDRDDMVSTVMSTLVSATVHCARCHDHKFDPITQEDYYSLQAVFAGVDRADRAYDHDPRTACLRGSLKLWRKVQPQYAFCIDELTALLPPVNLVYAAASEFAPDAGHVAPPGPRPVHVLKRGDIHKPGALAQPGSLACVSALNGRFVIANPNNEGPRRAALARWITDQRNPLFARSIVNRIWQSHFGRGIVDTPSDFGRMGSQPSHPELLDWLAARFLADGGSLKRMHRLIVTSAVYRQAARYDARSAEIDADNRLLWRMNRRRLDAESVHDAILSASGQLDRTMGGPSVQQFTIRPGVHVTPVVDYTQYDWNGHGAGRRSIYRFLFRTLPDPFMDSLDEADASQLTAARNESVTPLQALALLNNRFVLSQSEQMARRLEKSSGTTEGRIDLALELILSRSPTVQERAELGDFARRHGLQNLCRLLFNTNEFLYVN